MLYLLSWLKEVRDILFYIIKGFTIRSLELNYGVSIPVLLIPAEGLAEGREKR